MLVKEVMVSNVRTVRKDDTIRSVAATICTNKISGMPVVDDDNRLLGIITEKDILNALLPNYSDFLDDPVRARDFLAMENSYQEVLSRTVANLMTKRVFTVSSDEPIMQAASKMALHRFRRIPVVEDHDKLAGIVSLGDIHKAIFKRELGIAD
ncbi:MAG: CBS domain-containing protein [Magnetococcales bacterium]|nr:CBS domain-containing protein [Magnetococcales bacterium]MBF0114001.1 CBS domain-containing protein [Magnetococcales bacterium]